MKQVNEMNDQQVCGMDRLQVNGNQVSRNTDHTQAKLNTPTIALFAGCTSRGTVNIWGPDCLTVTRSLQVEDDVIVSCDFWERNGKQYLLTLIEDGELSLFSLETGELVHEQSISPERYGTMCTLKVLCDHPDKVYVYVTTKKCIVEFQCTSEHDWELGKVINPNNMDILSSPDDIKRTFTLNRCCEPLIGHLPCNTSITTVCAYQNLVKLIGAQVDVDGTRCHDHVITAMAVMGSSIVWGFSNMIATGDSDGVIHVWGI